jgi:hypothetical protein
VTQNPQPPKKQKLYRRKQLFALLQDQGLPPFSMSVMNKLCAPSVGLGPPVACYAGKYELYTGDEGVAWGESLLSPTKPPPLGKRSVADRTPPSPSAPVSRVADRKGRVKATADKSPPPPPHTTHPAE